MSYLSNGDMKRNNKIDDSKWIIYKILKHFFRHKHVIKKKRLGFNLYFHLNSLQEMSVHVNNTQPKGNASGSVGQNILH